MLEKQQYPEIEIDKIIIPRPRPHAVFSENQMEELKTSIREHGFIVPIVIEEKSDGTIELRDGENRIEAAKQLGYTKVPYTLYEGEEKQGLLLSFQANWIRGFQNILDGAEAMAMALEKGATQEDLVKWTGYTPETIKKYLILNDLPPEFKDALRKGLIPAGVIYEAAKLRDEEEIYQGIKTAIDLHWGIREMQYFVANRLEQLALKEKGEAEYWPEDMVSKDEAIRMARLRTCGVCGGKYDMDSCWGGLVCFDCLSIVTSALKIASSPAEAREFVEKVVKEYKEREIYERLQKKYGPQPPSPTSFQRPPE